MKKLLWLAVLLVSAVWPSYSAPKRVPSIKDVRTVYVQRLQGDRVFARRLMNEMRALGLRFVSDKKRADASLSARGDYSKGQFFGVITFHDKNGRVIWSAQALRPRGSNYMASRRLTDKLRAASRK